MFRARIDAVLSIENSQCLDHGRSWLGGDTINIDSTSRSATFAEAPDSSV